jgi:hypothetical protein
MARDGSNDGVEDIDGKGIAECESKEKEQKEMPLLLSVRAFAWS